MAYLVAPGNHIAPLGDTPDASVGSDSRCTLGIRGDFGLKPVHFHIFRSNEGSGAKVVPVDPVNTPVCVNGKMIPAEGKHITGGDTILAGFIELIYQNDDEVPEEPQPVSAFFEAAEEFTEEKTIDPIAELLDLHSPAQSPVPTTPEPISVAPKISHLPSAAAPNAPAAVPAAKAGGILQLPKRTAPRLATATDKTIEAFKRSSVRWSIRSALAIFFLAVGSSLLNARFPLIQNFWSDVGLKVKHVLEPEPADPESTKLYQEHNRDA